MVSRSTSRPTSRSSRKPKSTNIGSSPLDAPPSRTVPSSMAWSLCVLTALTWAGCTRVEPLPPEIAERLLYPTLGLEIAPSVDSEDTVPGDSIAIAQVDDAAWIDSADLPWTYAEVHYIRGARVGYSLVTVSKSNLSELNQLRVERTDVIDRSSDGSQVPIRRVTYEAIEKPNGEVASFHFRSTIEDQPDLEVEGRMIFEQLDLVRTEHGGKGKRHKLEWPRGAWGPMGIQSMLMRTPMHAGEARDLRFLVPQLGQFVDARLEAVALETTPVASGALAELLRIDVLIGNADSSALSRIWTDERGVIQKIATLSGESILRLRVDENTVRRLDDQGKYGHLIGHSIELAGSRGLLEDAEQLTLQARSLELDPFGHFLTSDRQELRSISASECEIKLSSSLFVEESLLQDDPGTLPDRNDEETRTEQPGEEYLASSSVVPTNSPLIAEIANEFLNDQISEPLAQQVESLRAGLVRTWNNRPATAEIKSTLAAARSRTGSAAECAALLAALLRQQQVPSRLVGGLRIDPETATAHFHIWNQAWIKDRWHDIDATQPASDIGPYHLAMTTTDAPGDNPYEVWLSMLEVLQEILEVEVVSSE